MFGQSDKGGRKKRGDSERDQTFNLQRRQTSETVIFQPTAVTTIKKGRKRMIKEGTERFDYQILVNCKMQWICQTSTGIWKSLRELELSVPLIFTRAFAGHNL